MLLYRTWRDTNGLRKLFSCYAWVVFYELKDSVNGLLILSPKTLFSIVINVISIVNIDTLDTDKYGRTLLWTETFKYVAHICSDIIYQFQE